MAVENDRHQRNREERHDKAVEAQKELIEQNLMKMQVLKSTLASTYGRTILNVTMAMRSGLADPTHSTARAKIKGLKQQIREKVEAKLDDEGKSEFDLEREANQAEQQQIQEPVMQDPLEGASIGQDVLDPAIIYIKGAPITNEGAASAAIMQFAYADYGQQTINLTAMKRVHGIGRIALATDIIRNIALEFMVKGMRRKFAPEDLFEIWMMLVDTGIMLPQVENMAEDVLSYLKDKLTPEEIALTTPARLATVVIEAIKQAFVESIKTGGDVQPIGESNLAEVSEVSEMPLLEPLPPDPSGSDGNGEQNKAEGETMQDGEITGDSLLL